MPRPKGSIESIIARRQRALALLQHGLSLREVARQIGCNPSSVMRWRNSWSQAAMPSPVMAQQ